jgi:hypothetical protein
MRKALTLAAALVLLPGAAFCGEEFDFRDLYGKAKSLAESLVAPEQPSHRQAKVPAAEIDPKMALVPRDEGRMPIIAPPGAGGDQIDPR